MPSRSAQQWLKEAEVEGKFSADQQARFDAAISFAEGNAYNLSFYRMDERWYGPFAEAIRFFVRSKEHVGLVSRLMDYRFNESEYGDRARGDFLSLLQTKLADLSPEQINLLVGSTLSGRFELAEPLEGIPPDAQARETARSSMRLRFPIAFWRKIVDQLHARWKQIDAKTDKDGKAPARRSAAEHLRHAVPRQRAASVPPRAARGGERPVQSVVHNEPLRHAADMEMV